ncbi:MAG: hypothetical protein KC731_29965, partial [Myxococcales bacterium]|nr:hypothetical protein [Myxococcales bacterium]
AGAGGDPTVACEVDLCPEPPPCQVAICTEAGCGTEPVPADTACTAAGGDHCDGAGRCVKSQGKGCAVDEECASGLCVDDICCATTCEGPCQRCDDPDAAGICTPLPAGRVGGCTEGSCDGTDSNLCATGDYRYQHVGGDGSRQRTSALFGGRDHHFFALDFTGQVMVDGGSYVGNGDDIMVVRSDQAGVIDHVRHDSLGGNQEVLDIVEAGDGAVTLVGLYGGTNTSFVGPPLVNGGGTSAFALRLAPDMTPIWQKDFFESNANQLARGVVALPKGLVVVGGDMRGSFEQLSTPSTSDADVFLVALEPNHGATAWQRSFGDANNEQRLSGLDAGPAGALALAGEFEGAIDFGGGPFTAGSFQDGYVAVLDAEGSHLWSHHLAVNAGDVLTVTRVVMRRDGSVVVLGSLDGTLSISGGASLTSLQDQRSDLFLLAFDATGQLIWAHLWGNGIYNQTPGGLATDRWGNVAVAGGFRGPLSFGGPPLHSAGLSDDDAFVVKLAADGTPLWAKRFGAANDDDRATQVAFDADGQVLVGVDLRSTADFGGGAVTSQGDVDFAVVCFAP